MYHFLCLRINFGRDPPTFYPPTIPILDECNEIVKELWRRLHHLLTNYDLHNKMSVSAAEKCSCEFLGIMSYFVHFCIEFQLNHGEALFCKDTYMDLKHGIHRLKELRLQWAYIGFLEDGGDIFTAKHVVSLLHTDVQSVRKKKLLLMNLETKIIQKKRQKEKEMSSETKIKIST